LVWVWAAGLLAQVYGSQGQRSLTGWAKGRWLPVLHSSYSPLCCKRPAQPSVRPQP